MTDAWKTSLPDFLQKPQNLLNTQKAVEQWSRTVAYLWTPILAFAKDPEKVGKERTLKTFIVKMLQKQCQKTFAYESYGDNDSKDEANLLSKYFKYILLGENSLILELQKKEVDVTLSDVLLELSGQPCIFTKDKDFTQMFTFRVTTEFTGKIIQVLDDKGMPVDKQYISLMAFPPRPIFSEVTVTEKQLYDWAKNINTGGNYLPPSIYVPMGGT